MNDSNRGCGALARRDGPCRCNFPSNITIYGATLAILFLNQNSPRLTAKWTFCVRWSKLMTTCILVNSSQIYSDGYKFSSKKEEIMKNLRKLLILGTVGASMLLGLFVVDSNAQRRSRGWSVNVSFGQPYYRPAPQYIYRRPRYLRPVRYRTYRVREYRRPVVVYPGYYNTQYYVTPRRKYKNRKYRNRRVVYRNVNYW